MKKLQLSNKEKYALWTSMCEIRGKCPAYLKKSLFTFKLVSKLYDLLDDKTRRELRKKYENKTEYDRYVYR